MNLVEWCCEQFVYFLKEILVAVVLDHTPLLVVIGELILPFADILFDIVHAVPLWMVRVLVFAILAVLAVWVFRMPPQYPETAEGKQPSRLKDLRFFAAAILVLQALLYVIF